MEVTCPACAARYNADEQKLQGKTARMRCKACDTVWLVSGPEATSEAKRVRRNTDREHRDLFASKPLDLGSVKQTLRPPPPETNQVAARNETSVLFTVDSLKGAARVKTPEPAESPIPQSARFVDDDEGIIDLNALASVPPKAGARSVAPLFSETPPAAFVRDASASSSTDIGAMSGGFMAGKRLYAGIAAAAVAVVLLGVGVVSAFKGEEPVARAQATMVAPIAPPPAAAPAPKAPEPPPATTTASSSSDDDAQPPAVGVKGKGKGKGKGKASGAKLASGGKSPNMSKVSSSGVAPVKPAADKCGCKGDFNCILRCTATGK